MIVLPSNLPREIRTALDPHLDQKPLERVLGNVSASVMELFAATDVLAVFERETQRGEDSTRYACVRSSDGKISEMVLAELAERWVTSSMHRYVRTDLTSRLASISYSAFSWPYPRLTFGDSPKRFDVPREYTLLLPFCSDMIVRTKDEREFFGYMSLFFDSFPSLADTAVQLIITLPALLSEVAAAYLRAEHLGLLSGAEQSALLEERNP